MLGDARFLELATFAVFPERLLLRFARASLREGEHSPRGQRDFRLFSRRGFGRRADGLRGERRQA